MKRRTQREFDRAEMLDTMRRTNPVAVHAFRRGNASGAHVRLTGKVDRRKNRQDERNWQALCEDN